MANILGQRTLPDYQLPIKIPEEPILVYSRLRPLSKLHQQLPVVDTLRPVDAEQFDGSTSQDDIMLG